MRDWYIKALCEMATAFGFPVVPDVKHNKAILLF